MAVRNKVTQNFEKIPKSFFLNVAAADFGGFRALKWDWQKVSWPMDRNFIGLTKI